MNWVDIALSLARGLHLAATLSVFGTALFSALLAPSVLRCAPPGLRQRSIARQVLLMRVGVLAAFATAFLWLPFQSAEMAGAADAEAAFVAMPDVLIHTGFGSALLARLALLAGAVILFGSRGSRLLAFGSADLAGIAVVLQIRMGHAAAAEDWNFPVAEALHLLAAGAWLGGLLPLLLTVRRMPLTLAALLARRFSPVGLCAVAVLGFTAAVQAWLLIGGWNGFTGTGYGRWALAKFLLFQLLMMLAVMNRVLFTPALSGKQAPTARHGLLLNIGLESALGIALVIAAATMATLPPPAHNAAPALGTHVHQH